MKKDGFFDNLSEICGVCFYTCGDCNGPLSTNCIDCNILKKRELDGSTCPCIVANQIRYKNFNDLFF